MKYKVTIDFLSFSLYANRFGKFYFFIVIQNWPYLTYSKSKL